MILYLLLMVITFFQPLYAEEVVHNAVEENKLAEYVLNSVAYVLPSPSIIGQREWNELQLDRLISLLDRTKTSLGAWGLTKLLHPIVDKKELLQRQTMVRYLVDNPEFMNTLQQQLEQIKAVEKSFLSYWDPADQLNQNGEQFYFSLFGLKELNKSSLALNASTLAEMFYSWKYLLQSLALNGVGIEFARWAYGDQDDINLWRGVKEGLAVPLRMHSLYPLQIDPNQSSYKLKDYAKSLTGSWYDKYLVLSKGYSLEGVAGLPVGLSEQSVGLGRIGGALLASVPVLFFDYNLVNTVVSIGKHIFSMHNSLNQLQARVADVAHCVELISKIRTTIAQHNYAWSNLFTVQNYDQDINFFMQELIHKRFLQKPGYLYSRGHVLVMHKEIQQIKNELIPLLQTIALIDAYCSVAQLYKENQDRFSVVEFVESSAPFVRYDAAWLPLLAFDKAIANDLVMGNGQPGKIIITGPIGSGKSTILKTYGIAAVLAQSWGIVPAKNAQQTLVSAIRTSFEPKEDLAKNISKGMAGKRVMAELSGDILAFNVKQQKLLVLIDEPYTGMVDDESAKRIYQFGKDIAGFKGALVAIATHTKKPILLAQDTGGIFGNYQVKIKEISFGIFKRFFTLEPGPAMWWFEDENQRSRFIDWIDVSIAHNA